MYSDPSFFYLANSSILKPCAIFLDTYYNLYSCLSRKNMPVITLNYFVKLINFYLY